MNGDDDAAAARDLHMWLDGVDGSSRCPRKERFAFAVLHQSPLTPNGPPNCRKRKCGHHGDYC